MPKTRTDWWQAKFLANVARDVRNLGMLEDLGWKVLVVWECEIRSGAFKPKLAAFLEAETEQAIPIHNPVAAYERAPARQSRSARWPS
jgi:G:T-mismatch repair DNA endonuclease (very short patch repair protein)